MPQTGLFLTPLNAVSANHLFDHTHLPLVNYTIPNVTYCQTPRQTLSAILNYHLFRLMIRDLFSRTKEGWREGRREGGREVGEGRKEGTETGLEGGRKTGKEGVTGGRAVGKGKR